MMAKPSFHKEMATMAEEIVNPTLNANAFHCPHCRVYANQRSNVISDVGEIFLKKPVWTKSQCLHCKGFTLWKDTEMVYPDILIVPPPNEDLPAPIRRDYLEAASIIKKSPRGAAALLRLAVQKLCIHLGEKGSNINDDIASLVKKGLSPKIQKGLDIVRVIGNEAVHPGTIDLSDRPETAIALCSLLNIIAESMLTQPKMIDELYGGLPETKKAQIAKRDS
jgi:hypothetical protein